MRLIISFTIMSLLALSSCSRTEAPPAKPADIAQAPSPAATPTTKPPAKSELRRACALITAAEMTGILGGTVSAEGDDRLGQTKCTYSATQGFSPYAELQLSWGDGEAGMAGMGMMGQIEPGMTSPYAGLGDQAAAAGPMLMIRRGEDLITIVFSGVDNTPGKAKQIYDMLDKRLPKSTKPDKQGAGGAESKAAKNAEAEEPIPDLSKLLGALSGMLGQQQAPSPSSSANATANPATAPKVEEIAREESSRRGARTETPVAQDGRTAAVQQDTAARGKAASIPLRKDLTIVTAIFEESKGDYETIKRIQSVGAEDLRMSFSAEVPGGARHQPTIRRVLRADLESAREYHQHFQSGQNEFFPGSTAISVSSTVLNDLKSKGESAFSCQAEGNAAGLGSALGGLLKELGGDSGGLGGSDVFKQLDNMDSISGLLKRVKTATVPVLVNDRRMELPAVVAAGRLGETETEFYFLDDPENPLALKWRIGESTLQVVKISFPETGPERASAVDKPTAKDAGSGDSGQNTRIEQTLAERRTAEVYGIYFDFASATIRPESDVVLQEIASAIKKNPDWKLRIDGHTDNVASDAADLKLSRDRAAAVKAALVQRYKIADARFSTGGYGEGSPKEPTTHPKAGRAIGALN